MEITGCIRETFAAIKRPTLNELRIALESLPLEKDMSALCDAAPGHLPYGRQVLCRTDEVEVIAIHIPAGSQTAIHDHGQSAGCARIIEGNLLNVWYELDRSGYPEPFMAAALTEGEYMYAPRGQIHQMRNEGESRVVSLHVYAPPLSGTTSYRPYLEVLDFVI
ncbi:cysteine dioxygenase family protein [Paenibacillus sp. FJAT-26967]|uniref:cysteine dioxygenase n=1 Tax=Paenibacillus sp. FJAT-26967 TaxID=1729690 RepID=UPI000837F4E5|nr:cysteine dioxygenase family protein [Paenibacillus sp. FJAT-26967]